MIRKVEQVHDAELLMALKNLLDFGIRKQGYSDQLEQSINRGVKESEQGNVNPHNTVMDSLRARYKDES